MLKSLFVHRLVIAGLLAVIAVLWFHQSHENGPGTIANRIAGAGASPEISAQPLAERLRNESRPEFPIHFDADMNEFQLVYSYTNADGSRGSSWTPLHYDPFTGARLPESTRASYFETPDPADAASIKEWVKGATTLRDVRRILGDPDLVFPGTDDIKQQWTYSRLSKTVILFVQETTGGQLTFCYGGQEKK